MHIFIISAITQSLNASVQKTTYEVCMDSCFFNVFCHSCHICASVFKVCVKVGLVLYGEGHSLDAWLLIREGKLIQDVNILKSIRQRDLLTHCVIPLLKDQTHINSVSAPGTFTCINIISIINRSSSIHKTYVICTFHYNVFFVS